MTKDKYIGIENELTSFKKDEDGKSYVDSYNGFHLHNFTTADFDYLLKDRYFKGSSRSIRSSHGNRYYVDEYEIEIVTPPIALNKGFATRLTNALVLGRNYVIENTPHLLHTGYSMHWNLSHDDANFDIRECKNILMNDISIPFQLFGLTPTSLGFNVRPSNERYEVIGDSLTNVDQINATALLLGAYSAASETTKFKNNNFLIKTIEKDKTLDTLDKKYWVMEKNMLTHGRYSQVAAYAGTNHDIIIPFALAQNILELFYEWISPFVYKLGEHDEINNLEAFIKGEKKLEMDDLKYFNELKKSGDLVNRGVYPPINIETSKSIRSPVLKTLKKDNLNVPIEGELLGIYVSEDNFDVMSMNWSDVSLTSYTRGHSKYFSLNGIEEIFNFAAKYHTEPYFGSIDTRDVLLNDISNNDLESKLTKRINHEENKELST